MTSSLTQQGLDALRQGNRKEGFYYLSNAVKEDPQDERAWLGLSACVADEGQKRYCLERVLQINPMNPIAMKELHRLNAASETKTEEKGASPTPSTPAEPPAAEQPRYNEPAPVNDGIDAVEEVSPGPFSQLTPVRQEQAFILPEGEDLDASFEISNDPIPSLSVEEAGSVRHAGRRGKTPKPAGKKNSLRVILWILLVVMVLVWGGLLVTIALLNGSIP